jgi:hypothetical protein
MKKQIAAIILIGSTLAAQAPLLPVIAQAQSGTLISQAQKPLPPETNVKVQNAGLAFGLEDGVTINLKFVEDLSSKTADMDQPVKFEVAEDVWVKDRLVIPKGAPAKGQITKVRKSGMLGRKGKLEIALKEVTLFTGERVAVRASKEQGGGVGADVIVLAAIVNPLFLLIKGKNVTYKAGTEFKAYVNGDFELDPAKFTVMAKSMTPKPAPAVPKKP